MQLFAEVSNPYTFNLNKDYISIANINKALIDLSYYARDNISNYGTITSIPQENIDYLSSGLRASNCREMFRNCNRLTSIPWNDFNIDTSRCTDMYYMFGSTSITTIDLSSMDTSNVTDMGSMFSDCRSLTNVNMSGWDVSKVRGMTWMFNDTKISNIDMSSWDTSSLTSIQLMFTNCDNITKLDLSTFDTTKLTDISSAFSYCTNLTTLILPDFSTGKLTSISGAFQGCGITTLDLSNMNTSNVTDVRYTFRNCEKLQQIICPNGFDLSSCRYISDMFDRCNPSYSGNALHLKNVPRSLDLSEIGGTQGQHYIIDSYLG